MWQILYDVSADTDLTWKKVPLSQIVYVNFEDERLLEMTADDLNTILEIGLELSGAGNKPYLFLDEIQNIDGWENSYAELQIWNIK